MVQGFAEPAVGGCIGQAPHTGVPEIVACTMHPPTVCEQLSWCADVGARHQSSFSS